MLTYFCQAIIKQMEAFFALFILKETLNVAVNQLSVTDPTIAWKNP